jgi:hypothetical protein
MPRESESILFQIDPEVANSYSYLKQLNFTFSKPVFGQEAPFQLGILQLLMMDVCFVEVLLNRKRASGTQKVYIMQFQMAERPLEIHFMGACQRNVLWLRRDITK